MVRYHCHIQIFCIIFPEYMKLPLPFFSFRLSDFSAFPVNVYPFFKRIQKQICITVLQRARTFFLFFPPLDEKDPALYRLLLLLPEADRGKPSDVLPQNTSSAFFAAQYLPVRWHLQNKFFLKLCQFRLFLKTFFLIFSTGFFCINAISRASSASWYASGISITE